MGEECRAGAGGGGGRVEEEQSREGCSGEGHAGVLGKSLLERRY